MSTNCEIQLFRKIFLDRQGYLILSPWPECTTYLELTTEPGEYSEGYFGKLSILFGTSDQLRTLAKALNDAADDMDADGR